MRPANVLVADVLAALRDQVREGVTTAELDAFAEAMVREAGGTPAFKGYRGFPATLCTSVNEEVIHGIPGARALGAGDVVSIDLGVVLDGFYGDAAITVPVGPIAGTRCSATSRRTGSRWCGTSSATASADRCTRTRRCPTSGRPGGGPGWSRA